VVQFKIILNLNAIIGRLDRLQLKYSVAATGTLRFKEKVSYWNITAFGYAEVSI